GARPVGEARAGADRRRDRPRGRVAARPGRGGSRGGAAGHEPRPARGGGGRGGARGVTSLDRPVGEEGETALGDLLEGGGPPPDQEVEVSLSEQLLRRTIEELPDAERDGIPLRFGLPGAEPQPLRETGRR